MNNALLFSPKRALHCNERKIKDKGTISEEKYMKMRKKTKPEKVHNLSSYEGI